VPDFLHPEATLSDTPDTHQCTVCNRGPGSQGEFRYQVDGARAELDRGRVLSIEDGLIIVPTPLDDQATISILIDESTSIKDGTVPGPGAEIRVRGVLHESGTVIAGELEVLCPGPTPVAVEDVPDELITIETL